MANHNQNPADDIAAELTGGRHALYGGPRERKEIVALPLEMVTPDERQVRQTVMDQDALEELTLSIKTRGLLQPITVRPNPSDEQSYIIVAGHRRFEAHKRAELDRIDAIIRKDLDERQAAELQLLENLQREDLSPLDEAAAYQRFIDEFGYTQDDVADRVGRNRTSVSKTLKINQLPQSIKDEYGKLPADKRVGKSALIEIASAGDEKTQLSLWRRAKSGADVRAVREERQVKPAKSPTPAKAGVQRRRLVETLKFAEDFRRDFRKRLTKITDDMLSANMDEARSLATVYRGLLTAAEELKARLSAAKVLSEEQGNGEAREMREEEVRETEAHPS
jgi:ParB family chromosome partitioning protein